MSDKPPKTQTDREKLEEMQREQRELEAQLAEDFSSDRTALEDKGATEAKLYEAEQHAGLDTPEGQVALARAKYIKEKLAHDNWKAKLNRVSLSMGIKKGAAAEKRAGRDKLDRTKKEYDESRVALGNKMLRDQRSILEKVHTDKDGNVDHKAVDLALAQYKATEILKTVVIDERQAIIDAKAAESATEMVMLKKVLGGYMGMKPWKRRALGISLGLAIPAYGVAAAGFGIAAVVGFAGLGAVKIGRSLLTGTVSTLATGYIHRRRNLGGQKLEAELEGRYRDAMGDNNFKENSGYIKLSELQSFDQKGVEIPAWHKNQNVECRDTYGWSFSWNWCDWAWRHYCTYFTPKS